MNSILREISGATLAAEVRLLSAVHRGAFLLVEGYFDVALFRQFVDHRNCTISTGNGKDTVLGAIAILDQQKFGRALGVIDADFRWCNCSCSAFSNVMVTDRNDMELVILSTSVFRRLLIEYGSAAKITEREAREGISASEAIFREASFVGAMRLASRMKRWNIKIESTDIVFASNSDFAVDKEKTARRILDRTKRAGKLSAKDCIGVAMELVDGLPADSGPQHIELCSGHDVCRVIAKSLRSALGSYNSFWRDEIELQRVLRVAMSYDDFRSTRLYSDIRRWEGANQPLRILVA